MPRPRAGSRWAPTGRRSWGPCLPRVRARPSQPGQTGGAWVACPPADAALRGLPGRGCVQLASAPRPGTCARASPGQCSGTHPAACTHRATHAGGGRPPRPRPAAPHQPRRRLRGAARPTRRSASRERDPDRRVRQRGLRRDRRAARLRLLLPAVLQVRAAGSGQRWAWASGRRARPRRAPPALSVCLRAGLSLFLFFSFFFIECFTFLQRQTFFL